MDLCSSNRRIAPAFFNQLPYALLHDLYLVFASKKRLQPAVTVVVHSQVLIGKKTIFGNGYHS